MCLGSSTWLLLSLEIESPSRTHARVLWTLARPTSNSRSGLALPMREASNAKGGALHRGCEEYLAQRHGSARIFRYSLH
jgi:hypothetical protein